MKKWFVVLIAVLCWPILWAGNSDNIMVTSGSVLTSTADTTMTWANPGITLSTSRVPSGQIVYAKDEILKRYISIWIIDQDENVPLDKSILYEKAMVFTDKTADEIRAGIPLLNLLETHNQKRLLLKDKEDKPLKKIRLRDLQIVIKTW